MTVLGLATISNTGRRNCGRPIWKLTWSLSYGEILVPAGFETDLASVPRLFWRIASPIDAIEPAIIHDYLCRNQIGTRKEADRVFVYAMADYGVAWWRRTLMYVAVRVYATIRYPTR